MDAILFTVMDMGKWITNTYSRIHNNWWKKKHLTHLKNKNRTDDFVESVIFSADIWLCHILLTIIIIIDWSKNTKA